MAPEVDADHVPAFDEPRRGNELAPASQVAGESMQQNQCSVGRLALDAFLRRRHSIGDADAMPAIEPARQFVVRSTHASDHRIVATPAVLTGPRSVPRPA